MIAPGTLNIVSAEPANEGGAAPPTIFVVASGIQIVNDGDNWMTPNASSWTQIDPPLIPDPRTCDPAGGGSGCGAYIAHYFTFYHATDHRSDPVDRIQVVACDVAANKTTLNVDQTGQLVEQATLAEPESQLWYPWAPSGSDPSQPFLAQVLILDAFSRFRRY